MVKKTMALCALVVVSLANVKAEDVEYEYEVSNRAYDFAGAQSYCESGFGGQVTSITSQAERNLIHNLAKAKGTGNYWIGAERVGSSDSWYVQRCSIPACRLCLMLFDSSVLHCGWE